MRLPDFVRGLSRAFIILLRFGLTFVCTEAGFFAGRYFEVVILVSVHSFADKMRFISERQESLNKLKKEVKWGGHE